MIENNIFNSRIRKCFNTIPVNLVIYQKNKKKPKPVSLKYIFQKAHLIYSSSRTFKL